MKKLITVSLTLSLLTGAMISADSLANSSTATAAVTQKQQLPAPKVKEMFTSGFQMNWTEDPKAHRYQIQINTKNDFRNTTPQDRYKSRWSGEAVQNTTYYVRYRTVYRTKGVDTFSEWSKVLKTKTKPRFPSEFKSKYKRVANGAEVTWSKSEFATKYRVVLADNKAMDKNVKTWWTSKNKITIPLNSRDGQVKYVKVYSYNADFMRHSERIPVFPKTPTVTKGETIKVVSQNLLCSGCKVDGVKDSAITWAKRAPIHLAEIKAKNPDIILIQEGWNSKGAQTSFYKTLNKRGYASDRPIEKHAGSGYSNRVLYKTSKYKKLKSGVFALPDNRRSSAWVHLKSKKTGKEFYVVSTHPSPYVSSSVRVKSAEIINAQMKKINKKNRTMIVGGDMNSSPNEALKTTHSTFIKNGWTDAASAKVTKNLQYSTHNGYSKKTFDPGYSRIDYIYSKNTGGWSYYENVIKVSKGKITSKHGSDHNMLVGITTIK